MIELELRGLELHGRHGVLEEERDVGQRFLIDLWLGVPDAALSDRIEDAVDYRDVAEVVRDVFGARTFDLLEALAGAVADALLRRFPLEHVRVRVRKPDVRLDPPVEFTAATVERTRR